MGYGAPRMQLEVTAVRLVDCQVAIGSVTVRNPNESGTPTETS